MDIGVPKEIKDNEYRVSVTPGGAKEIIEIGNKVNIQKDAGIGSGYSNEDYIENGCTIYDTIEEIYENSELIVKVKEPIKREYELITKDHIIFSYLHLSSNKKLVEQLIRSKATCIAYETIERNCKCDLLAPMSEVAGREAAIMGAYYLGVNFGGKGVLISGVSGIPGGRVLILGAGIVGKSAAKTASGLGAEVIIMSPFIEELRQIELEFDFEANVSTRLLSQFNLIDEIRKADIIISAVYIKGGRTPILIKRSMLKEMEKGTVIVAVDIDQGSSVESARPTTHFNPVYIENGIVHYCVTNMPGIYSKTSTLALTNLSLKYIKEISQKGIMGIIADDSLVKGINIYKGKIVYKKIAEDHGMMEEYSDIKIKQRRATYI